MPVWLRGNGGRLAGSFKDRARGRIRTADAHGFDVALYTLSYPGKSRRLVRSLLVDSARIELAPPPCKSGAIPLGYEPRAREGVVPDAFSRMRRTCLVSDQPPAPTTGDLPEVV